MSARPALTDDAIAAMLAERADRLVVPVDVGEAVRAANTRPGRFGLPAVSLGLAAAAVAVVAVALAVGPVRPGPVASAQPTRLASAAASASTSAQVTPLTPAQLGKLARTRSAELDGRLAVVIGTVSVFVDGQCTTNDCTRAGITDGGDGWILRPTPEAGSSFPRIGRGHTGAFLVRFTSDVERQHPVVDLVAPLITDDRDRWTSTVATILSTDPGRVGDYAVIDGWLVHEPLHPCPSVVAVPPLRSDAPSYGCPDTEYLTDDRYQPLQADGSSIGSSEAIVLPVGSYDEWAPDPQIVGTGVEPRRWWYVVRKRDRSCGPTVLCIDTPRRWGTIIGVLNPLSVDDVGPGPTGPSSPPSPPSVTPSPSGLVWTVDDISNALGNDPFELADGRLLAVRGWLVATPPLRCRAQPAATGAPSWGCDEIDWITPDPFDPWVSDGTDGSVRTPDVGLHVQVGAYAAFARPGGLNLSGPLPPAFGTYLVRGSVHSGCETLPAPIEPSAAPCAGPAVVLWEVVGRADIAVIPPLVLPSSKPGSTPVPGTDGSGDSACLPIGTPCGEEPPSPKP